MAELEARGLRVVRDGTVVLDGVDLRIERGDALVVMGGSGAGKSTLLQAVAGLVALDAGDVSGEASGQVGLALQRPESALLEPRVLDDVVLGARCRGMDRAAAAQLGRTLLEELGLPGDVAGRDPLALSGGEQRRVAIAGVLAAQPRVLALDEPGAGLDAVARRELWSALGRLQAAGVTTIVVTHDPAEAVRLGSRLVVVVAGRIAWDGPVAPVLGDPARARALGIDVAPEVAILHEVAAERGVMLERHPADPDAAVGELARIVAVGASAARVGGDEEAVPSRSSRSGGAPGRAQLPPLVDARARLAACALAVAAALAAGSLAAAGAVALASAVVLAAARVQRARVRLALRPLVALTATLVLLDLLVAGGRTAPLVGSIETDLPASAALLRSLQAVGIVLATLALSAKTAPTDLAAGIRWWLAPLRVVRVPVGSLAFVVATGLGLVPAFADELDRLRLAQRARGLRAADPRLVERLRADAALLAPLFVAAFRRAHLRADALAVRGVDPRLAGRPWRGRITPGGDRVLVLAGVLLLVVSRFA